MHLAGFHPVNDASSALGVEIRQSEDVNLTVTGSGGQFQSPSFESGDQDSIRIAGNTPQSITVVSTGGNWFVLNDNRSQDPGE